MVTPKVKILSHNAIDTYTLIAELMGEMHGLIQIHNDPWKNVDVPHFEQFNKQVKHVQAAIIRYENKINYEADVQPVRPSNVAHSVPDFTKTFHS